MHTTTTKSISHLLLTPRQEQILGLLSEGMSNQEIADELHIQHGTVKQHLFILFRKLQVTNRAKAVIAANQLIKGGHNETALGSSAAVKSLVRAGARASAYVWRMISVVSVFVPDNQLNFPELIIRRDKYLIELRRMIAVLSDALDGKFVSLPYGGMLIWFGHPCAHVDDADRAVQFAQLLQQWSDSHHEFTLCDENAMPMLHPIGIGIASHPEVVAAKAGELTGVESFRMAAILARHARPLGRPLADALTQKLAPLSVPWFDVKVSSDHRVIDHKRFGRLGVVGARGLSLPDIRSRWGGMLFLDSIFEMVEHGVSQWLSVESWPPAATTSLIDAIGNAAAARSFRLLRLRVPTILRRERLAASFVGQLDAFAKDHGLELNHVYAFNSAGERLGAMIADLAAQGPLVVQVYGLKGLDALAAVMGDRGVDRLVSRPVLVVAGHLSEPSHNQTNIRLLGARPAGLPFSRIFSMQVSQADSLADDIRADLQALIDGLSEESRTIITAAASQPEQTIDASVVQLDLPHHQTQTCLHELASCGLLVPHPGGGFQFRDLMTANAISNLTISFVQTQAA